IKVRPHKLRVAAFGDITGERQALRLLVHSENCAHHSLFAVLASKAKRKKEPARGQIRGVRAEISLIKLERRASIELVENVAYGARDQSVGSERIPTTQRPIANAQAIAIEPDRGDRTIV